jgi:hypothetical protein
VEDAGHAEHFLLCERSQVVSLYRKRAFEPALDAAADCTRARQDGALRIKSARSQQWSADTKGWESLYPMTAGSCGASTCPMCMQQTAACDGDESMRTARGECCVARVGLLSARIRPAGKRTEPVHPQPPLPRTARQV